MKLPYETSLFAFCLFFALIFEPWIPNVFWIGLLLTLGMYHGGYDVCIIDRNYFDKKYVVYSLYFFIALLLLSTWWFFPFLFVAVFILETLIHFGTEDTLSKPSFSYLEGVIRGALPFVVVATYHGEAMKDLFTPFLQSHQASEALVSFASSLFPLLSILFAVFAFLQPKISLELGLIFICFRFLPPIPSFTLWFVLLHGLRHLRSFGNKPFYKVFDEPKAWGATLFCSLPLLFIRFQGHDFLVYPFMAFAALTLPHAILHRGSKKII